MGRMGVFTIIAATALIGLLIPFSSPQEAFACGGSEPFLGSICWFGFNFPPRNWAFCDGQLLPISQNTALFSLLGTTYGGDGETTFALPDMRGRSPVHVGTGPGLDQINWGQRGGTPSTTLSVANLPSHNHGVLASTGLGDSNEPTGKILSRTWPRVYDTFQGGETASMSGQMIQNTGGGQAFDNRSPYLGIHCSIALTGIYPSRN